MIRSIMAVLPGWLLRLGPGLRLGLRFRCGWGHARPAHPAIVGDVRALLALRDRGNTVIVVEHEDSVIRVADHIVDIGPGAGEHGGKIVAEGSLADIEREASSLTGDYLAELTMAILFQKTSEYTRMLDSRVLKDK